MTSTLLTRAQTTGTCPKCQGNWETCTCTGVAPLAPRSYERDETDRFHQLVDHLVDDGDTRARTAGRRARRTLAEMAPGYARQPVLLLTRPLVFGPEASR